MRRTITKWSSSPDIWVVYQSWAPDLNSKVAYRTFKGSVRDRVIHQADDWLDELRNPQPEPPPKKRRGNAKDYGAPSRARSTRASAPPASHATPARKRVSSNYTAGPGRSHKKAATTTGDDFSCRSLHGAAQQLQDGRGLVKHMEQIIWKLNVELVHRSEDLKREKKERLLLQGKLSGKVSSSHISSPTNYELVSTEGSFTICLAMGKVQ